MHAIQPVTPIQPALPRRRRSPSQTSPTRRTQRYRTTAIELTVKLTTNLVLSACVISAMVKILPHFHSSEEKLTQIQSEVQHTQERVESLQADFSRHFDPQQAASIMQEHSNRVAPGQRPVIWLEELTASEPESPLSNPYAGLHP